MYQQQQQQHSPLPQQQHPRPSLHHQQQQQQQQYAGHPHHPLQGQAMYPQEQYAGYVNPNLYPGYSYTQQQQPMTPYAQQHHHHPHSTHPYPIYAPPHGGVAGADGAYYYYDQSQQYLPIPPQAPAMPYSSGPSPSPKPSPSPSTRGTVNNNRSPRPTNNGSGRMNSFVFPPPVPLTTKRGSSSQIQHTSQPSIASSASVSSANLPARPNFEPASSESASSSFHGSRGIVPTPATTAHRATNGTTKIAKHLLDDMPPLPPVSAIPDRPEKEDKLEEYIISLHAVLTSYKAREEAMDHRIQALAFRPADALRIMQQQDGVDGHHDIGEHQLSSITGVRLLQKVAQLQKENDELGQIVASRNSDSSVDAEQLTKELQDAHTLIASLSQALTQAEEIASKAQRALQAAVDSKSVGFS